MTIEFIGYIGTRKFSETHPAEGPIVDRAHIEAAARAHEEGGFDRALVAFHSTSPESILIAQHAAFVTERLGLMVAHRPGFTAPTLAARQFATLDQLSGGRAAVHIITGGDDAELRQDGSFLAQGRALRAHRRVSRGDAQGMDERASPSIMRGASIASSVPSRP